MDSTPFISCLDQGSVITLSVAMLLVFWLCSYPEAGAPRSSDIVVPIAWQRRPAWGYGCSGFSIIPAEPVRDDLGDWLPSWTTPLSWFENVERLMEEEV